MVKRLAVLAMVVVACRGREARPVGPHAVGSAGPVAVGSAGPVAVGSAGPVAGGSAAPRAPAGSADPWAVATAPSPDDPPTLSERHRFANEACPSVTAPYFYKVVKAGKTSYMLGTRHVSVPLAKFPEVVRTQLRQAKLAVFEVAPDDHSSIDRPGYSLSEKVGPVLWAHYGELVGKQAARSVENGRASTALIQAMVMYEDISAMLDIEIEHEVARDHIPARGLESAAFQDDLLDRLLDDRMLRVELEQTKDRKEIEQDSHDDLAQYCAGSDDTPGTDAKTRAMFLRGGYTKDEIDHMDDLMVFQRNAAWIPELEKLFAQGGVFVAVGADHLIGDKGVVALLRAHGYTITRVTK
jgi:uncharacterized protein YbaP (TraB family)